MGIPDPTSLKPGEVAVSIYGKDNLTIWAGRDDVTCYKCKVTHSGARSLAHALQLLERDADVGKVKDDFGPALVGCDKEWAVHDYVERNPRWHRRRADNACRKDQVHRPCVVLGPNHPVAKRIWGSLMGQLLREGKQ